MPALFPESPSIPASSQFTAPVCEWIVPASSMPAAKYFGTRSELPNGMPDCLQLSIAHSADGTERCTAAIYGGRAYVIHFEFKPQRRV